MGLSMESFEKLSVSIVTILPDVSLIAELSALLLILVSFTGFALVSFTGFTVVSFFIVVSAYAVNNLKKGLGYFYLASVINVIAVSIRDITDSEK